MLVALTSARRPFISGLIKEKTFPSVILHRDKIVLKPKTSFYSNIVSNFHLHCPALKHPREISLHGLVTCCQSIFQLQPFTSLGFCSGCSLLMSSPLLDVLDKSSFQVCDLKQGSQTPGPIPVPVHGLLVTSLWLPQNRSLV